MSTNSLWGEIPDLENIKTPGSMLAEQGEMLSEVTSGRLKCRIDRSQSNNRFTYEMKIVVPCLANYSQKILKVTHDLSIYPVMLSHEQSGREYTARNDAQFMAHLGEILSSEENRLIICGLNAQVRLAAEDE